MNPITDDYLSPPPAYSEQHFDQKVSRATELSLQTAKWEAASMVDDDGWQQYDPSAFEGGSELPKKGGFTDEHQASGSNNYQGSSSAAVEKTTSFDHKQDSKSKPNNL